MTNLGVPIDPSAFTYADNIGNIAKFTFVKDVTITNLIAKPDVPLSSTHPIWIYWVASATPLPTGLSFDTANGTISGTFTDIQPFKSYTVYLGPAGSGTEGLSTTVSISVVASTVQPTAIAYNPSAITLVAGAASSSLPLEITVTPTGGALPSGIVYSMLPGTPTLPLPANLTLSPSTGTIALSAGSTTVNLGSAPGPTVYSIQATIPANGNYPVTVLTTTVTITILPAAPTLTSIAYPNQPFNLQTGFPTGEPVTTPTVSPPGADVRTTFAVVPSLPAGLELNPTTGVIYGAGTAEVAPEVYVITATQASTQATAAARVTIGVYDSLIGITGGGFTQTTNDLLAIDRATAETEHQRRTNGINFGVVAAILIILMIFFIVVLSSM